MTNQAEFDDKVFEWPYQLKYSQVTHINVDVLVVGGGLAGSCAAIAAARRGAKVAVADKGPIKRSGCGGAGMDHWNTLLSNPDSPMTPEQNAELGNVKGRPGHRDYIAVKGTWDALMDLEKFGLPIRADLDELKDSATIDNKTKLYKAYNYKDLVAVKLRGGQYLKPVLYNEMREQHVSFYERVMINNVYTEDGKQGSKIVGASGVSLESGEFFVFHTPCVILSCGYSCTIWTYNMEITGNSWRWDPNEIGEGLAMAWKAGADIDGMHKNGKEGNPSPFAWPRFGIGNPYNTWFPCSIVDNNGKEIPWEDKNGKILTSVEARNMPAEDQIYMGSTISDNYKQAKTPSLIHDLPERIRNGEYELPLWADLPGMPEDERRSIWGMMIGNEGKTRYTIFDIYTRKGFNPDKDMLMAPIMLPEEYNDGGWFHGAPGASRSWRSESFGMQASPATDWNMMTTVPGLFCAGANSGLEGSSFACSSGFYAGNRGYEYAKKTECGEIVNSELEAEIKRVYEPVNRYENGEDKNYISWKELWNGSTRVMQQCCAEYKTDSILNQGLRWFDSIKKNEVKQTYARNPHELVRVLECDTRITISEMYLHGCKIKIENDKKNLPEDTYVFNRLEENKIITSYKESKYWLKAPYEPSYLENYQKCCSEEGVEINE